ncbi:MAG: hypothetical protein KIT07_00860 [Anaerolineales bacterium]|nr:hypothetical protein [Anaerolineales bacterium]
MILSTVTMAGSHPALSVIAQAIKALYGAAEDINEFLDKHIVEMKDSENPTIARTGRVLEMAKYGFGIGYITPVIVIAVGQLLLGNPLSAAVTVVTAATFTNPIAMTCAAIGAIYYGWGALTEVERSEILEKLSNGLEVGIELIKSIVHFIVDKTKELLSSKNIEEMKKFIAAAAATFGKTLGDVTHKITDVVSDSLEALRKKSGVAIDRTVDIASDAYMTVKETAGKVADHTRTKIKRNKTESSASTGKIAKVKRKSK